MDKFIVACMVFSFICGAFFVLQIEAHRELTKGCAINFTQGKITVVSMGHTVDE